MSQVGLHHDTTISSGKANLSNVRAVEETILLGLGKLLTHERCFGRVALSCFE